MAFPTTNGRRRGFTLMELLVSLAIIALLLTIAVPRYFSQLQTSKETVLRENLRQMRDAIDKFYGDNNRYPQNLDELVTKKYLRRIPPDPLTGDARTWVAVPPADKNKSGVYDIKSGAPGNGKDGTAYSSW